MGHKSILYVGLNWSEIAASMLKLTKKADYGLIALRHLATARRSTSAKDIADAYRIPVPLLSKILQKLVRSGPVGLRTRNQRWIPAGARSA